MLITLTTDFGLRDGYVGTMKGVMLGIAPDATLVDITHDIAAQDLRAAAYVLWRSLPYFAGESVHLIVVDPGVGTARRAIASRTSWGVCVAPDNGVLSYVWATAPPLRTVSLESSRYRRGIVSRTFHGRDIFAPAAAYLALGVPLHDFGPVVDDPVRLDLPLVTVTEDAIRGEVIYIDRFGNAVTSIGRLVWEGPLLHLDPAFADLERRTLSANRVAVHVAGEEIGPIRRTYGDVEPGAILALVGSEGMLEIAASGASGAEKLGLAVGDSVTVAVTTSGRAVA